MDKNEIFEISYLQYDIMKKQIASLEAQVKKLSEPRACDDCKHFYLKNAHCSKIADSIYPNYQVLDDSGFYIVDYEIENKNFHCSYYEPKDKL